MQNNELEELKSMHTKKENYISDDEISLIDMALVLIRRKILIGSILTTSVIFGLFFSLSQSNTATNLYNYETSIFIGGRTLNSSTVFLEPPNTVLNNIKYIYIPQVTSNYENKYLITVDSPINSGIISLKTQSKVRDDPIAINLLTSISNKAISNHDIYFDSIKASLSSTSNPENPTDIALQLASLKKTSTLAHPIITEDNPEITLKSPVFILILSVFIGLFVAIFAVFLAEFIAKVKERQYNLLNK